MRTSTFLKASTWKNRLLLLLGLGSATSCSSSWSNSRTIYLRNQTAFDLLLTWKIPRAALQVVPSEYNQRGLGAALVEAEGIPPDLKCSSTDTLLDNYEQALPVHSHLTTGDSILLTVRVAPGQHYLLSSRMEFHRQSCQDQYGTGGFTFLPCIIQWMTAGGQWQHQSMHPLAWRREQDQEADSRWNKSYILVRYIDFK